MKRTALCFALLVLPALPAAAQTTTYTYTGDPYTFVAGPPYTAGSQLTGTFTTAAPLPPFLPLTDVRTSVVTASFNDSAVTRTFANSAVCTFKVATDGVGHITEWEIFLRETPFTPGSPQHSISSIGFHDAREGSDVVGTGNAGATACDPTLFLGLTQAATQFSEGAWTDTTAMPSTPTTYTYTGANDTSASSPYSSGSRLNGTITTANPLPAFMPLTDITASLTALSFHDSIRLRTLIDSYICSFQVATDGAGEIKQWQILLRAFPIISFIPEHTIESNGNSSLGQGDLAGTGIAPPSTTPCAPMIPVFGNLRTGTRGTWTDTNPLPTPSQPTTYTYTGDPYTSATAPYSVGGSLTGTLVTANPLPPSLPLTDVGALLTSYSFTDGVQTRMDVDSALCSFKVATDGAGNITMWQVFLRKWPYTPGLPQHSIESAGNAVPPPEGTDLVGSGLGGALPCSPFVLSVSGSTVTQGTWIPAAASSSGSAPALGDLGLALLTVLLAAAALYALSSART
jgi:hypothetical protein